MHLVMRDRLEKALAGTPDEETRRHLAECPDCSAEFGFMKEHAEALRLLQAPVELEPRAGFYARVMERIEAEGASIWDLFFESVFGRRIAIASLALALLFGVYLISAEHSDASVVATADQPVQVMPSVDLGPGVDQPPSPLVPDTSAIDEQPRVQSVGLGGAVTPDQDSVLVNLVTYREQ
jgi:predicted anti-sigma-YlaC factor YlaD